MPTAAIATAPLRFASSTMAAIASIAVRSSCLGARALPRCLQALAEPRDARRGRRPCATSTGGPLADVELDRVRADVDHRVAGRLVIDERRQAPRVARVDEAAQAHRPDRRDNAAASSDSIAIVRVAAVRHHLGDLGHAAADHVADPALVDAHGAHPAARSRELADELVEGVRLPVERRRGKAKGLEDRGHVGGRQGEAGLHHRPPLLEAVLVHLDEDLDVHEVGADLHVVAGPGQEVELVAFLDPGWRERRERRVGGPEALPKGAPLPAPE